MKEETKKASEDYQPGPDDVLDVRAELLRRVGEWFDSSAQQVLRPLNNRYPEIRIMLDADPEYGDGGEPYFRFHVEERVQGELEGYQANLKDDSSTD